MNQAILITGPLKRRKKLYLDSVEHPIPGRTLRRWNHTETDNVGTPSTSNVACFDNEESYSENSLAIYDDAQSESSNTSDGKVTFMQWTV